MKDVKIFIDIFKEYDLDNNPYYAIVVSSNSTDLLREVASLLIKKFEFARYEKFIKDALKGIFYKDSIYENYYRIQFIPQSFDKRISLEELKDLCIRTIFAFLYSKGFKLIKKEKDVKPSYKDITSYEYVPSSTHWRYIFEKI